MDKIDDSPLDKLEFGQVWSPGFGSGLIGSKWQVVSIGDEDVGLQGPMPCRGYKRINLSEFFRTHKKV